MPTKPLRYTLHSTLPQHEITKEIISFMNHRGWMLTHKDAESLIFARNKKPDAAVFVLLLFLMILPAFLYLLWGGRKEAASFFLSKDGDSTGVEFHAGPNTQYYGRLLDAQLASGGAGQCPPGDRLNEMA